MGRIGRTNEKEGEKRDGVGVTLVFYFRPGREIFLLKFEIPTQAVL